MDAQESFWTTVSNSDWESQHLRALADPAATLGGPAQPVPPHSTTTSSQEELSGDAGVNFGQVPLMQPAMPSGCGTAASTGGATNSNGTNGSGSNLPTATAAFTATFPAAMLIGSSGPTTRPKASTGPSTGKGGRRNRSATVCQVEGCTAVLDGGKPFYRLQRICEVHARALSVTDASGKSMRFCQQCTRLHPVTEFEGGKRSCAVSLLRRMERKQRQQQERALEGAPPKVSSRGRRARAGQNARLADGVSADAAVAKAGWTHSNTSSGEGRSHGSGSGSGSSNHGLPVVVKPEPQVLPAPYQQHSPQHQQQQQQQSPVTLSMTGQQQQQQQQQLGWAAGASGGANSPQSQPMQHMVVTAMPHMPMMALPPGALPVVALPHGMVPQGDAFQQLMMLGGGAATMAEAAPVPAAVMAAAPAAAGAVGKPEDEFSLPVLSAAELDELLTMDPDELAAELLARTDSTSAGGSQPAVSGEQHSAGNSAGGGVTSAAAAVTSAVAAATASIGQPQLQPGMFSMALAGSQSPQRAASTQPLPIQPSTSPLPWLAPDAAAASQPLAGLSLPDVSRELAAWPVAQEAAAMLQGATMPMAQAVQGAAAAGNQGDSLVVRFSLKAYGMRPEELPDTLQQELQEALTKAPTVLNTAVRSGCTHITATLLLSADEAAELAQPAGTAAALARLLRAWQRQWRLPARMPLLRVVAQAQSGSRAALLQPLEEAAEGAPAVRQLAPTGGVTCAVHRRGEQQLQLRLAGPAATTVGSAGGRFRLYCDDWEPVLLGTAVLHCRSRGRHVPVTLLAPEQAQASSAEEEEEQQQQQQQQAELQEEDAEAYGSEGDEGNLSDGDWSYDEEAEAEQHRRQLALMRQHGVEVWVPEAVEAWGLYEFELSSGSYLGAAVPVLVLPNEQEAAAAELQQLQAATAAEAAPQQAAAAAAGLPALQSFMAGLLQLAGMVLLCQEQQQQQPAAELPATGLERLATAARWLSALCVRCHCPALLRCLLLATTCDGSAASVAVAGMDAQLLPAGLLGTAAAAGSGQLLLALADWAAAVGHKWQLACPGSTSGMTVLHLAAAMGRSLSQEAAAALVLVLGTAAAADCWCNSRAGGWTPRQVAAASHNTALLELLDAAAAAHLAAAAEAEAEAAARKVGGDGSSAGGSSKKQQQLLLQEQLLSSEFGELGLGLEKKGDAGSSAAAGTRAVQLQAAGDVERLPVTAAELQAWQKRPLQPAMLLAFGGSALLIVLGLLAAFKSGLYD